VQEDQACQSDQSPSTGHPMNRSTQCIDNQY
jgi:hypothetical protein